MKKWLVLSVLFALLAMVCGGYSPVQAQTSDLKPTFMSPTPGVYVNAWPRFAVSYPKDWVEQPVPPGEAFRVGVPRPSMLPGPVLAISALGITGDISGAAKTLAGFLAMMGSKEVKVLSDKPTTLQDGTPAQEAELEFVPPMPNAPIRSPFMLTAKKDDVWIYVDLIHDRGMIGDDLKAVSRGLKLTPGKAEPVKVPPDVQAFMDKWCSDIDSHDAARIMSNYSDLYRNNGTTKAAVEGWYRMSPDSPIQLGVNSATITFTIFEPMGHFPMGDKAYVAGFFGGKLKGGAPGGTPPISDCQVIKENGQWKWYGNQK